MQANECVPVAPRRPMNRRKIALSLAVITVFIASACNSSAAPPASPTLVVGTNPTSPVTLVPNPKITGTVYALWPNTTTPAWPLYTIPSEVAAFKQYLPNVTLVQLVGNNDLALQQTQVEAAITAKADAVVFSPVVPTAAGGALKEFADAKIPVIALRQDPIGGPVNSYVWVDFEGVGKFWGDYLTNHLTKDVGHKPVRLAEILGDPTFEVYNRWTSGVSPALNALVSSGQVQIVCKTDTKGFVPASAQAEMDQCLTTTGGNVDAVLVMQDSTGNGVAASLASQNLLGKVKFYGGHDGDVVALQRVLLGEPVRHVPPGRQADRARDRRARHRGAPGEDAAEHGLRQCEVPQWVLSRWCAHVPCAGDARHRSEHAKDSRGRRIPANGQDLHSSGREDGLL